MKMPYDELKEACYKAFLLPKNQAVEKAHKSLDVFCDKFSRRVQNKYVVHTKDYKWENGIKYILVYMVPFLW